MHKTTDCLAQPHGSGVDHPTQPIGADNEKRSQTRRWHRGEQRGTSGTRPGDPTERWRLAGRIARDGVGAGLLKRPSTIVIYNAIALGFADVTGEAWPGVERLTQATGYSRRAVQLALRDLEDAGLIATEIGGGHTTNRYRLTDPGGLEPASEAPEVGQTSATDCAADAQPSAHQMRNPVRPNKRAPSEHYNKQATTDPAEVGSSSVSSAPRGSDDRVVVAVLVGGGVAEGVARALIAQHGIDDQRARDLIAACEAASRAKAGIRNRGAWIASAIRQEWDLSQWLGKRDADARSKRNERLTTERERAERDEQAKRDAEVVAERAERDRWSSRLPYDDRMAWGRAFKLKHPTIKTTNDTIGRWAFAEHLQGRTAAEIIGRGEGGSAPEAPSTPSEPVRSVGDSEPVAIAATPEAEPERVVRDVRALRPNQPSPTPEVEYEPGSLAHRLAAKRRELAERGSQGVKIARPPVAIGGAS